MGRERWEGEKVRRGELKGRVGRARREKEAQCREGEGRGRYRREKRRWINEEKKDGED